MLNINKSLEKAVDFLVLNQNENSLWSDFYTTHHYESIDWVSAYTALALLESKTDKVNLSIIANNLVNRQNEDGGWGYNEIAPPDADVTSFVVMFLQKLNYEFNIKKALEFIEEHQNPDGSFSSFTSENIKKYYRMKDLDVIGWCSGIPEVTATALRVTNNKQALKYLKNVQREDGSFPAYWWNSDIYATTQVIISLDECEFENQITKGQEWLTKQSKIDIPFYQALLIEGLILNNKYSQEAKENINDLLDKQLPDGSWPNYPILRFPHPSNTDPWNNKNFWREEAKDQNRIFTTATCLQTLAKYLEYQ